MRTDVSNVHEKRGPRRKARRMDTRRRGAWMAQDRGNQRGKLTRRELRVSCSYTWIQE